MNKILYISAVVLLLTSSCDKVENPYPNLPSSELDYNLYPNGDSAHYAQNAWPIFIANTNTLRSVMIEDYTGHYCTFCPAAADEAENIASSNPGRVFVSSVHAGPFGTGSLQQLYPSSGYTTVLYNTASEETGNYFGNDWPGSLFTGNPYGSVSRTDGGNGTPTQGPATWNASTTALISANDLKANLQSQINYYPSTRGLFVHAETEIMDLSLTNELKMVVQLHEDTLVAFQKLSDNSTDSNYVHHDILRSCIDGRTFGQTLDAAHLDVNGKYYFNYSYELPAQYDASNMHLLIYIRDNVTEEIYHVIKKDIE